MSCLPPQKPFADAATAGGAVSYPNSLADFFDPEWFAQNSGPLFEEWLRTEYRGNVRVVAQVFGVSQETVSNWLRLASVPSGRVMLGAVIAFPPFYERVQRAYHQHLDRRDAATIRAARQRQKARRASEAA